jgi:hypothetical protein
MCAGETAVTERVERNFTLRLGGDSHLDLPVRYD